MDAYKFCVILLFLFFLSLGSVSASDDNFSFEPLNDSFVNNESEIIDENLSNFNNISDDNINYSAEDLKNDSEYLNSSLEDRGGGNSSLSLIQTTITAYDLEMYYRDGSVVYATLKDIDGNPLVNKTVIYILAGQNYIRITNSIGRVAMGIYARPGNYTVNITFHETGYTSSSKTVYVTVNEMPTSLFASDLVMFYRDGSALAVDLRDVYNNPLVNKTIVFNLVGHDYIRVSNSNGRVGFGIFARPGNYSIYITFESIGYVSSSKTVYVMVNEMPTSLFASDLVMFYRDGSALAVDLRDVYNNPLVNKTIVFNLVGHDYIRVSNSNGRVGFGIYARPGNYTLGISFEDIGYISSNKTVYVTVNEMPTILIASDFVMEYGDTTSLYAFLKDKDNNPLVNKDIIFNINENNFTRVSDDNGCAGLEITLYPGIYNATISFAQIGYITSIKLVNITVNGILPPDIDVIGGFYDSDYLLVNFSGYAHDYIVYYSFDDGIHWAYDYNYACFNLTTGNWSIKYFSSYQNQNSSILSVNYLVDGSAPICWASHGSGIYESSFHVNLTSVDFFDENPVIYYTLDGSDPTTNSNIYSNPLLISDNSNLRFVACDCLNHMSELINIYYFFGYGVANLDNGRFYSCINNAISDSNTLNGDSIEISNGVFNENLNVNKSILLIGNDETIINGSFNVLVDDVGIYNCKIDNDADFPVSLVANNVSLVDCEISNGNGISCINNIGNSNEIINCTLTCMNSSYGILINNSNYLTISDCIINSSKGNMLINSNYCELRNNIFLRNDCTVLGCNKLNFINCFNNTIYGNNLSCGLVLNNSGENVFYSNWIKDNLNFYLIHIDSLNLSNTFYLNYIHNDYSHNNKYYGVFIANGSHVNLSDNWWGSDEILKFINFENSLDENNFSFIVLNSNVTSYKVMDGMIYGVNITVDLTHNSDDKDLSKNGYLPKGIVINYNNAMENKSSVINKGICNDYFALNSNNLIFDIFSDDYHQLIEVNRLAVAHINVYSTAIYNEDCLNFTYDLFLNESVKWVSLVYRSLGNFSSEVDLIVNGNVVKNFTVINNYYYISKNMYHFSDDFFNGLQRYKEFMLNDISNINAHIFVYLFLEEGIVDLDETNLFDYGEFNISSSYWQDMQLNYNKTFNDLFLDLIQEYYNLDDWEILLIREKYAFYQDNIKISIEYPGDIADSYSINNTLEFTGLGNNICRTSKISYVDGSYKHLDNVSSVFEDHLKICYSNNSISFSEGYNRGHYVDSDYDGFFTFTFVSEKLDNSTLVYWLNEKNKTFQNGGLVYDDGYMKAVYGSFLNGFLVFYCLDQIADVAGNIFNVSWNRTTPIAIGVWDNHYETYLSGQSSFRFGMDVFGERENVHAFNAMVTSMFSPIEYWVMKTLFPDLSPLSSVTMGLSSLLFNGSDIEFVFNDYFTFILMNGTNNRVLIIDEGNGFVCDFLVSSVCGAYCYSIQQTDWACVLAQELFNLTEVIGDFLHDHFDFLEDVPSWDIDDWEDFINGNLNWGFGFLDEYDNIDFITGIVGSFGISLGVALLVSNPIGWGVIGGAALLIGTGLLLDYYANDLNKEWTYARALNFGTDIVLSVFSVVTSEIYIGKIVIADTITHPVSKKGVNEAKKIIIRNLMSYGSRNIEYKSWGTFSTAFHNTFGISYCEIFKTLIKQSSLGLIKSFIINYLFENY